MSAMGAEAGASESCDSRHAENARGIESSVDSSERLPFDLTSAELASQDRWLRALVRRLADAAEVDDVVQDTWIAALRTRPEVARPRAWLSFVAANFARRTRRAVERREWREREAARPESSSSTADSLAVLDLQEDVLRALRALREPYRRVILLRYTHGRSVAEIAA
jgi:RNA polymerase sigma factor (sigma-70 family)